MMTKIDLFVEKNYDLVKKHFYQEAKDLGYAKQQYKSYFDDCKCFVFVGKQADLDKEMKEEDYYIIARENDLVIAEMFNGLMYNFI